MGRAVASKLAADGLTSLWLIAAAGRAGGCAVGVEADVSRTEDLRRLIQAAVENFGRLDVLISNAGIETRMSLLETSEADFDTVLAVNLKGTFFGAQFAAQQFVAQHSGGLILTISSTHEDSPMPGNIAYCVSKGGAKMLTRTAGVELGSLGIRFVNIAPGAVSTPINAVILKDPEALKRLEETISRPDCPSRRDRRCRGVSRIGQGRVRQRHHGHHRRRSIAMEHGTVTAMPAAAGNDHYDVLIIGSGPGDAKYTADETFYDLHDRAFRPELHYYVGGDSKVYSAALFRVLPGDFGEVKHPNGVAPAWPLSYEDTEPCYVRAGHLFWVHGKHGEDPFAGLSSRDYKYPPVQHEPRIQRLSDDLEKLGLHPFHLPLGVHALGRRRHRDPPRGHTRRPGIRIRWASLPGRRSGARKGSISRD